MALVVIKWAVEGAGLTFWRSTYWGIERCPSFTAAKRTPSDSLAANRAFPASMLLAMARSDMSVACLQA